MSIPDPDLWQSLEDQCRQHPNVEPWDQVGNGVVTEYPRVPTPKNLF